MKKYVLFIGIDISKKWFDASLTIDVEKENMIHRQFDNSNIGFKKLAVWIKKQAKGLGISGPVLFCMEHTGVYTLPLCLFLEQNNYDYVMESALRINRSLGIRRGKDDKSDSKDIAQYAFLHIKQLKISTLPIFGLMKIKNLLTHRARMVKQRAMLKSSSKEYKSFMPKQYKCELIADDSQDIIELLDAKIKAAEKAMLQLVKEDEQLSKLYGLVSSVKGVGLIIAMTLLVYTNCFKAFDNARKFACYIAIAPFSKRSGTSLNTPAKVSKTGYTKIKALISNGAATAIQHDKQLRAFYNRKLAEGKVEASVMNAVKNKLIARIFAVVKRGTPFVEFQY